MKRHIEKNLQEWKHKTNRKPLILRGARQVGKTYIINEFGKSFRNFIVINFEKTADAKKIFDDDLSPDTIIQKLSILTQQPIIPGHTLLFLDEIQVSPKTILALRYFYEEMPELHVIAAGSLIDFALDLHGVPVGRVSFLYLYPMSFIEFLEATESDLLVKEIFDFNFTAPISDFIHNQLLKKMALYMSIGGMPEAIKVWKETGDIKKCQQVHANIVDAYNQDFGKYAKTYQHKYIDIIFNRIPSLLGEKIKYANLSSTYKTRELSPCLDLLIKAGVVHKVYNTSSQEPPLGANKKIDHFKSIFLDIGLAQTVIGLNLGDWILDPKKSFENKGPIIEAFVGQELLAYSNPERKEHLYYWHKENKSSKAEIDYVIQKGLNLIPIEVKSGITGGLKSLIHYVTSQKAAPWGIHFSQRNFEQRDLYTSLPLYLIRNLIEINIQ